jgi:hypothetical protein
MLKENDVPTPPTDHEPRLTPVHRLRRSASFDLLGQMERR